MLVEVTSQEARQIEKAIRLLRDRHYYNYQKATTRETAEGNYKTYQELDELRRRFY